MLDFGGTCFVVVWINPRVDTLVLHPTDMRFNNLKQCFPIFGHGILDGLGSLGGITSSFLAVQFFMSIFVVFPSFFK